MAGEIVAEGAMLNLDEWEKPVGRLALAVQMFRVFQRVGGAGVSCAMDSVL